MAAAARDCIDLTAFAKPGSWPRGIAAAATPRERGFRPEQGGRRRPETSVNDFRVYWLRQPSTRGIQATHEQMPKFDVSPREIDTIVAYINSLSSTISSSIGVKSASMNTTDTPKPPDRSFKPEPTRNASEARGPEERAREAHRKMEYLRALHRRVVQRQDQNTERGAGAK